MMYCYRLVGGLPLHVDLFLLKFAKLSKLRSLLVQFKLLVGDPNCQRPCGKPKLLPPDLVVAVPSSLWSGILFLHFSPGSLPAPWLQQYVVIHQMGWWCCPSFLHLGTILPLSFLEAPAPSEWTDLLRLYISAFRFLSSPWRFHMVVCSVMLSASLVERQLAYSATCSVRVIFPSSGW